MQRIGMRLIAATSCLAWGGLAWSGLVVAADTTAGKAAAQGKCSQCHAAKDWEGEGAASLASLIRDIGAGKVKHKVKIELTPTEIDDIAAYWGSGGKTKGK
jgi:mono/diheme cytochrome c family protein